MIQKRIRMYYRLSKVITNSFVSLVCIDYYVQHAIIFNTVESLMYVNTIILTETFFYYVLVLDFLGKAKKILKSDNPFDILEKTSSKSSQQKQDHVEWDPQDFGKKFSKS
jgi:hypothetical protein